MQPDSNSRHWSSLSAVKFFFIFLLCLLVILVLKYLPIKSLLSPPQSSLDHQGARTNLLLLGMGGAGHEAPELTDSLIFVSLNLATPDVVLLSIPRDLWVPKLRAKINTAYYYGEKNQPGGGLPLIKTAVTELLGQPVHYTIALNFAGFVKAIDLVGGIDIHISHSFDDDKYPIPGKETVLPESDRYERLHFDAGLHHFDGPTALKYVRSRTAEGDEGTDFARQARQQQILSAFKDKLFSTQTLLNPRRILELKQAFANSLIHDLSDEQIIALAKLALNLNAQTIRSGILDTGDPSSSRSGLLAHPSQTQAYDYQWVLIPRDPQELQDYVTNLIFSP